MAGIYYFEFGIDEHHVSLSFFLSLLFLNIFTEIKEVKRKKERAKELEGIDVSNIVLSSRRRSTTSFAAPPKPKVPVETKTNGDDAEDSDDDNDNEGNDEEEDEEEEEEENSDDDDDGSQSEEHNEGMSKI